MPRTTLSKNGLTLRQQVFVDNYLKELDATKAAVLAGCSRKTAQSIGSQWLTQERFINVQRAVAEGRAKLALEHAKEASNCVIELAQIAFANPKRLFKSSGAMFNIHDLPDEVARTIAEFVVEKKRGPNNKIVHTIKVRFWSKLEALKQIAQHLGLLKDQININVLNQIVDWSALQKRPERVNPVTAKLQAALPPKEIQVVPNTNGESTNGVQHEDKTDPQGGDA